jgi:hypothetical protein
VGFHPKQFFTPLFHKQSAWSSSKLGERNGGKAAGFANPCEKRET